MIRSLHFNRPGFKNVLLISVYKLFEMADLIKDRNLEFPKNIRLNERPDRLLIEYSWFKLKYFFLLGLFPVGSYVVIQSNYVNGSIQNITIPVLMIILLNLAVIYYSLMRLINTTIISVNHNKVTIEHKPLPFNKNLVIQRSNLVQLYVTRHRTAHRYYLYSSTYQINAILSNKQVITLVKGLYDPEQGRFIEKKIEKFLNITDVSVEGELEKN